MNTAPHKHRNAVKTHCIRGHLFDEFNTYYDDMIDTFKSGLTLERINVNGDYSPSNCRWASIKEQANNRRSHRIITYNGITKNLQQWSEYLGIRRETLAYRLNSKWNIEKAFYREVQ